MEGVARERGAAPMPRRDPLAEYNAKRDFARTPEPRAAVASPAKEGLRYFIQRHAATRLHYDFRLEWAGTLKSWAIPKGPSLDPATKRLAVQTEDHPLSYGDFEGTIPAGEYGAGEVLLWDRGVWVPRDDPERGFRKGKLHFELVGEKLRGEWVLFRLAREDRQWMLRKVDDGHARPGEDAEILSARPESVRAPAPHARAAKRSRRTGGTRDPMPDFIPPQLATLVSEAPSDPGWAFEVKYDGYRMLARCEGGDVRLMSRNGNDWTMRLAPLAAAMKRAPLGDGWLDGEIVVPGRQRPHQFPGAAARARRQGGRHRLLRVRPASCRRARSARVAAARARRPVEDAGWHRCRRTARCA